MLPSEGRRTQGGIPEGPTCVEEKRPTLFGFESRPLYFFGSVSLGKLINSLCLNVLIHKVGKTWFLPHRGFVVMEPHPIPIDLSEEQMASSAQSVLLVTMLNFMGLRPALRQAIGMASSQRALSAKLTVVHS